MTFHSPEFEFNDSFYNLDTTTLNCNVIGKYLLSSNQGDIHIITSSPPISTDAPGFYHRVVQSTMSSYRINSGLFYRDCQVRVKANDNKIYEPVENEDVQSKTKYNPIYSFLVYPWHRTGSLNNDCVRPVDSGSRSAILNQKKLINLMYFGKVSYEAATELSDTNIKVFNSD